MENPRVFFSYSRVDSEFVLRLAKDLRSDGVNLWIDQLDIAAGDRWDRAVEDALGAAPCLLVVLSPASVESQNVMDEVSLAFDEGKRIVPVLASACTIPFRLRRLQHVDFTVDYDRGLEGVLKALNLQLRPGAETSRDGADRSAAASPPRSELARSTPQHSSTRATPRKYAYAAVGTAVLAAAGGISFVLVPRYLDHSKGPGSTVDGAETTAHPPARPIAPQTAKSPAGSDSGPIALLPPPPEPAPTTKSPPPPDTGPGVFANEAQEAWNRIQNTASIETLEEFVQRFDGTPYANVARARLAELRNSQVPAVTVPGTKVMQTVPEKQVSGSLSCKDQKKLRSLESRRSTYVTFRNLSADTVDVYWLDFSGKPVFYKSLENGEVFRQQTFVSHPWMISGTNKDCLQIVMPDTGEKDVLIK